LKPLIPAIFVAAALPAILLSQHESHEPRSAILEEGLGRAHIECPEGFRARETLIEDSIDDLSQPPYPVIPANELCGNLLLEFNRPAEATVYFQKALSRTPKRPKLIFGLGRAAQLQFKVTPKQPKSDTKNS
jgi:hypothetical protein